MYTVGMNRGTDELTATFNDYSAARQFVSTLENLGWTLQAFYNEEDS